MFLIQPPAATQNKDVSGLFIDSRDCHDTDHAASLCRSHSLELTSNSRSQ